MSDDGFRFMTVVKVQRLSSRMQRLRLAGNDLHRFDTFGNLHLRLYVPGGLADGRPAVDTQETGYVTRYYTIRHIDADAGWLEIDFVLHDAPGPACNFARRAKVGDICGISGPCGLGVRPASRYLLVGDEAALPAICRILENLPASTCGTVLVETQDGTGRIELPLPETFNIRWFRRDRRETDSLLAATMSAITDMAVCDEDYFIWSAVEYSDWEKIRAYLRGVPKKRYINVAYWDALLL